jgi:hypothetical protein
MENSMEAPQKTKIRTAIGSTDSTSRNIPKGCKSGYNKGTCTPMLIAGFFTLAMLWKQPRCPTSDEWVKKMWYLYTTEYKSATKKNEILLFAGKWMKLENVILSEVSQAQKAKSHLFSLICGIQT